MRVALVSTEVRGLQNGGIGTYVSEAGVALTAAGHEVWLVTYLPETATREEAEQLPGFARVVFVEDCSSAADEVRFGLARATLRFAQLAHELLRDAGVPFDYIEFADYGASGAVAISEQRLFRSHGDAVLAVALHSPTYDCWLHNETTHIYGPTQRELAALEDETVRTSPLVWSPSCSLRDLVSERLGLNPADVPIVRYPASDSNEFTAASPSGRTLADLCFLFIGRIEPRKGVRELAAAFARMPELRIECVGRDGNTAPVHSSEVEHLKKVAENVTFCAHVNHQELLAKVRAADVVVLPSRWDNWPNTCLEAMAAGRIVIGGDNSGMAEMIDHGNNGFLVKSADADDLERVIREDLHAALPRLADIGRAAAARSRELCNPAAYVRAIEHMVWQHRGHGRWPLRAKPGGRVSIIVPYYSEDRELLGAAVQSAIEQTHDDLEILIVNDGSPRPDAEQILANIAERDPRIQLLHKANGGVATARNHALEHATGDFVLCLDADNLLRPDYAATGVDVLTRAPDAVAMIPRFQVFDDVTRKPLVVVQAMPFDRPLALFRNSLGDGGAMFRREVFAQHELRYDPVVNCYSDWALWLDIAARGLRVQIVPRTLYDYRLRANSMMADQAWQDHLGLLGILIERHLPPGCEREMLITLTQGWGVGALLAALGNSHDYWEQPEETGQLLQHRASASELMARAFRKIEERRPLLGKIGGAMIRTAAKVHGKLKKDRN